VFDRQVVQRRIRLLEEEGVRFQTNVNVGKDISARDLYEENDALVLCLGATSPRDLPLPGGELEGIFQTMAFLETWQKKQNSPCKTGTRNGPQPFITAKDKDITILSGDKITSKRISCRSDQIVFFKSFNAGDTSCDCIATCLRQGAKSITSFEILPQPPATRGRDNPWPLFVWPLVQARLRPRGGQTSIWPRSAPLQHSVKGVFLGNEMVHIGQDRLHRHRRLESIRHDGRCKRRR
jgi:glutamate synthase (NADH)